jgi:nicotinamidase-related amidase
MDLQPAVLDRFPTADDYLDRVVATRDRAVAAGVPVVLVRVAFRPGAPETSPRNKTFSAIRGREGMSLDDAAAQVHPRLLTGERDVVVTKKRVGAFAGSDLEQVLRGVGAEHLVLAGIATSGVVLTTVRDAADRDYELTVLSDLCADRDDEVHRLLTEKVFPRQAEVVTADTWRP